MGLPFHAEAYGGDAGLDRSRRRRWCIGAPHRITRGMIFACLDPDAASLEESLGRVRLLSGSLHEPQRGRDGGPRPAALADSEQLEDRRRELLRRLVSHAPYARERGGDRALHGAEGEPAEGGRSVLGRARAAGTTYKLPTDDFDKNLAHIGYPEEMVARMHDRWSADQKKMVGEAGFMVSAATIFPNLSFVHNWPRVHEGARGGAVHLHPALAAHQRDRDRGPVLVRRRRRTPRSGTRTIPTRPTSCASAPRACSSRTTSRTGRRSPRQQRRFSSQVELDSTMGMGDGERHAARAVGRMARARGRLMSATANTTSGSCSAVGEASCGATPPTGSAAASPRRWA